MIENTTPVPAILVFNDSQEILRTDNQTFQFAFKGEEIVRKQKNHLVIRLANGRRIRLVSDTPVRLFYE